METSGERVQKRRGVSIVIVARWLRRCSFVGRQFERAGHEGNTATLLQCGTSGGAIGIAVRAVKRSAVNLVVARPSEVDAERVEGEDGSIASIHDSLGDPTMAEPTTREAILRAAWRLLRTDGAAGISTRKVAREAGVNQALVHYHFGSLDRLMIEVLDHLSEIVVRRQKARYITDASFMDNFYADIRDLLATDHRTTGWGKVWLEATAIAVNNPDTIGRNIRPQSPRARGVLLSQLLSSVADAGETLSTEDAEGLVVLIYALRAIIVLDNLIGTSVGHERAGAMLGGLLESLIAGKTVERAAETGGTPTVRKRKKEAKSG